ncbi:MAG: MogA/MoaB family molybdenum cofactor biosynthesis protein [Planctomycetes bacterium]|nr:MogA/MoaB family molybdenum cofactor biosynthesis protein [Planctomycetota bacterium]
MSLERHREAAPKALRFAVITVSDTRDAATDRGGPFLVEGLAAAGHTTTARAIVRDERGAIAAAVRDAVGRDDVDLVLTTGGTGIAPRDVTVPTLEELFDSTIPGFGEVFRWLSYQEIGSAAILSRACAGLVAGKVVIALPGSPKALKLALEKLVLPEAGHLASETQKRA